MLTYLKTNFLRLLLLIFLLFLFPLYVFAEGVDATSLEDQPDQTAQAAKELPKLWVEYSTDKEVQAKYDDIMQKTKTSSAIDFYNRSISRVLYEYLQKNEQGKEYSLVDNFNEWYSKTAEELQNVKEDERKEYLNNASIEYIKPITEEIEGKFANVCAYVQYLFTHARYMFHFFPTTEYRQQIDGVVYGFTVNGFRCMKLFAYPIDKERTYANYTIIPLDGTLDLYAKKCVEGFFLEYNGKLYRLNINGIDQEKYPEAKQVLYELEQNKLNFKSICEIK